MLVEQILNVICQDFRLGNRRRQKNLLKVRNEQKKLRLHWGFVKIIVTFLFFFVPSVYKKQAVGFDYHPSLFIETAFLIH